MSSNIKFISAGAGSGKTYRLTEELREALVSGRARPSGIVGTTFTKKAAKELGERVRQKLIESGHIQLAHQMGQALLGTVNSVCGQLLNRFAFEAGLPPELEVLPEEDGPLLFAQALESVISIQTLRRMNHIGARMELSAWKDSVKAIVDAARSNNISPDEIAAFGQQNADDLLSYFPSPIEMGDLSEKLKMVVADAIVGIQENEDTTKGTRDYLELLQSLKTDIDKKELRWSQWVSLSKKAPTQKSMSLAEPVLEAASLFEKHPLLHADIREYCETAFKLAAESLGRFQELKQKRCVMDFVDQELLMLQVLENEFVKNTLDEELDILLVDEFQDTSPIQLALFLKLSALAREVVFVGDIKQAIYGFRGSDPELMLAVIQAVRDQGGVTDVLEKSWRSRPALVAYANAVFGPAFADTIPEEQIVLKPARPSLNNGTAVEHWQLEGKNKGLRADALADGIRQLLASGHPIVEKDFKSVRPVRYSDIAVLARTHADLAGIAEAIAAAGIPVTMDRSGLLNTPEACLVLACLRRLVDPSDTLASAEIISLVDCAAPEVWLENRLDYMASGGSGYQWGEQGERAHPVLAAIAEARHRLEYLSPVEAMSLVLHVADIRRTVMRWGPDDVRSRQRLQNISALDGLAGEYEDHCKAARTAATAAGLVLWLYGLPAAGQDKQPADPSGNAVHLLTHHSAKGLEWPVVVATGLEKKRKSRLWSIRVMTGKEGLALENPLADRKIVYWPWPFGKQSKGIPVSEAITASEAGKKDKKQVTAEEKRLMYVSMTRARDLLILPLPENAKLKNTWIETIHADYVLPRDARLGLPGGKIIPTARVSLSASGNQQSETPEAYKPYWFAPKAVLSEKMLENLPPSSVPPLEKAAVAEIKSFADRVAIKGSPEMDALGNALHSIIAAEVINPAREDAFETAQRIIDGHGLNGCLKPDEAVACARRFMDCVKTEFKPKRIWVEYPMEWALANGQISKGWIDALLETDAGWIIVDHKSSSRPRNEWEAEALKYSGQLSAYQKAVAQATARPVLSCWIHFPLLGAMINIKI